MTQNKRKSFYHIFVKCVDFHLKTMFQTTRKKIEVQQNFVNTKRRYQILFLLLILVCLQLSVIVIWFFNFHNRFASSIYRDLIYQNTICMCRPYDV